MSSPGQRRGSRGHAMASFDGHAYCARCRDKGKGEELCVKDKETSDCKLCNALTPEQRAQLATPSYKIKKEKREAKHTDSIPPADDTLVDPASVAVIGIVGDSSASKIDSAPPEKKPKKEKGPPKPKKSVDTSTTDTKISELNQVPDSRKVSSLSKISAEILLQSEIFVSAEILLKLRFKKGISAETKLSAKF